MPDGNGVARSNGVMPGMMAVEAEVLRMLPEGFLREYERLCLRAFRPLAGTPTDTDSAGVAQGRPVRARVSTGQTETRGAAHNRKRQGLSQREVLGSEQALHIKSRIDRKLRALARTMREQLEGVEEGLVRNELRRCSRCRTFAEGDWLYCPRDGAPTEQVD